MQFTTNLQACVLYDSYVLLYLYIVMRVSMLYLLGFMRVNVRSFEEANLSQARHLHCCLILMRFHGAICEPRSLH